ncbi:MAG TPA: hypothetical protein PK191_00370 [Niabella sp.]|nr:hypothetical protein [Niabella sp.]HOZ96555.1 hypothetical protein [Niabella sp.]HQW13264.1 hypothetical protein [Niabella sp.]HQX18696.1 hypothetical protein [Niabella sp.]HQX40349.1 hypothetical protein [Niabella sp.]
MIKRLAFLVALSFVAVQVSAQAYIGKIKVGKTEEPAIAMLYNFPKEVVANALAAKLTDKGLKGKSVKGFELYSAALITEISKSKLDYTFKLEEKGKRGGEKTTIYMLMEGSGNLEDPAVMSENGKRFLENLTPDIKRSNTIMMIKQQERVMADEEENLLSLKSDQKNLEEKLEKNKRRQEAQQKIIASQKAVLDDLKATLN